MTKGTNNLLIDDDVLLLDLFLSAKDHESLRKLLVELLTPQEKTSMIHRTIVAKAILGDLTYDEITDAFGVSSYMVSRVKREIVNAKSQFIVNFLLRQK